MNKEKINAGIDRMAEEAKETMNLMSNGLRRQLPAQSIRRRHAMSDKKILQY